jgi:hypothetical protein
MDATTSAERQAASVASLREAGGRRISVSLPKKSVLTLERIIRKVGGTQNQAIIKCIELAQKAIKATK